jgi:CRISPR-associated protein Cmr4
MFDRSEMIYLYVETPLHAGSGSSVGVVDLPIQRERVTHYPLVQASGVKGKLRSEASERANTDDEKLKVQVVFGSEEHEYAGALSPGDARLLLFPVRSLVGVFAYTTSRNVLSRFKRDLEAAGKGAAAPWTLDNLLDAGEAWTVDDKSLVTNQTVVLEEFSFKAAQHADVKALADWLADNAFPQTDDYKYFRDKVRTSLVILPEDSFRDFTQFATEVVARIRIDQEKKTVAQGALWTEEHLPSDTLLYAPLHASKPRTDKTPNGLKTADDVLAFVRALKLDRIQLGGDETIGRGIVRLRLSGGEQ